MKVGDYIRVKDGVSDESMPSNQRDGLIVELRGQDLEGMLSDQAIVMFSNGAFLKFHTSQIRVINENR